MTPPLGTFGVTTCLSALDLPQRAAAGAYTQSTMELSARLIVLALSLFPRQSAGFQPRSWVQSPTAPRTAPRVLRHVEIGESVSTQGERGRGRDNGAGRSSHGP